MQDARDLRRVIGFAGGTALIVGITIGGGIFRKSPTWFGRTTRAGLYTCEPAKTVVPFVDSGFGDGTYPVYYLTHDGRPVGLEAEFLAPGTPYL